MATRAGSGSRLAPRSDALAPMLRGVLCGPGMSAGVGGEKEDSQQGQQGDPWSGQGAAPTGLIKQLAEFCDQMEEHKELATKQGRRKEERRGRSSAKSLLDRRRHVEKAVEEQRAANLDMEEQFKRLRAKGRRRLDMHLDRRIHPSVHPGAPVRRRAGGRRPLAHPGV